MKKEKLYTPITLPEQSCFSAWILDLDFLKIIFVLLQAIANEVHSVIFDM
jgi:hypothetical protein